MADPGAFRINPLQNWQREAILKAAQLLRDRFGNPPVEDQARAAHDALLEVLDPARRTVRLQRELSEANDKAALPENPEREIPERRANGRRKANLGAPGGTPDRRKAERRAGEPRTRKQ